MITYNKLVRDKIIEKIANTGGTAKYHTATPEEFGRKLHEKLIEEARELNQAKTIEEIRNELSDILKVTQEIMKFYTISEEDIKEIMKQKDEKAGRFDKKIILDEASEF